MSLLVDIRKDFGDFRLEVAFEAAGGEVTGLLGASGCGKSLTLKCIAGIERPDAGRVELDGRVLFDSGRGVCLSPQQRRVGYLFQSCALFPHMTVAQNIAAGVRARGERRERTARLLRALHLEGQGDKYPRQLSGGQQQRAALARILASEPAALLLDEPFSALDSYLKDQVVEELSALLEGFPVPLLFVTHDREETARLCRQVCVLHQGRSQAKAPVEDLFRAPATLAAALLAGYRNLSRARLRPDGRVEALDWGVCLAAGPAPVEGAAHLGVEEAALRPAAPGEVNAFPVRVEGLIPGQRGATALLSLPGGRREARLRMALPPGLSLSLGQELLAAADPNRVLLLRES